VRWEPDYKGGKLIRRQVVENMPDPLSTLFSELYLEVGLEYSMDHMIETVGIPIDIEDLITRPFFVTVNGYAYCRADYKIPFRKIFRIIGWYAKMAPSFARNIVPRWKQEALPEYLSTIGRWKAVDSEMISDEELLSGIRELSVADAVYWFSVAMVMGIAKMTDGALHLFLTRLVKGNLISGMFLRGFPSKTLEAQVDLESIAKRIQTSRSLRDLVIATPAIQMIEILENDPTAALIAADLNDYLEKYGHQIYTLDFVQKTQGENPLPILMSLKSLVEDDRDDTNAIQAEISRDRKILEQQTLDSVGPVRRWIFRKLLRWAQTFGPNREEALFYVGGAWPTLRELAHELGNRLVAAGMLQKPEDIYYLKSAEISSACQARAEMKEMTDLLEIVDARIRLRESQSRLHPPPMVPEGRFKIGPIDMSFIETQKRNKDDSNVLNGFAVSPGRVTGEASVIMSPADFIQMKPDTILVCPTTTPAWTALFPQALALVTDIGGILAHGSIVAREFGIPAVMGTGNITERIVSGQRITVDGEAGTVTIASD